MSRDPRRALLVSDLMIPHPDENVGWHVFSKDLQCCWTSWDVVNSTTLKVVMEKGDCCDFGGAVRIAQFLMPNVLKILTVADDWVDTCYAKNSKGQWGVIRNGCDDY